MRHLRPADYTVSDWSGGRTVQLSIGPAGERYADRKFLWRISSATVELETSEFTSLPDYERLIAPIRGEMILSHNGGEEILLRPFDVHRFDGADLTVSKGKRRGPPGSGQPAALSTVNFQNLAHFRNSPSRRASRSSWDRKTMYPVK